METIYNIEGAKVTALDLRILAHVAGDNLVLEGFLERDRDHAGWLNVWRIPDGSWDVLGPHVESINCIIDNIGEV